VTNLNVDHQGIDNAGQGIQAAAAHAGGDLADFQAKKRKIKRKMTHFERQL